MQMRAIYLTLCFVTYVFASAAAIGSPAAPPPYPFDEIIAGDRLMIIDDQHRIWSRPLPIRNQQPWRQINLPEGTRRVWELTCAPDDSGNCAVGLSIGRNSEIGLLPHDSSHVTRTGVPAIELIGFVDSGKLYFGRNEQGPNMGIYAFDQADKTERTIGQLRIGESPDLIILDGRPTLIARAADHSIRTLDHTPALTIRKDVPIGAPKSASGMIHVQSWTNAWAANPQVQLILRLQLNSDDHGKLSKTLTSLGSLPLTTPIFDEGSLVSDFQGDLFGTLTGENGRFVAVICNAANGSRYPGHLAKIDRDGAVRLIASQAGNGALVVETEPGHAPHISVIQFAEPSLKGFETRNCDATVRYDDTGIPSPGAPSNWSVTHGSISADDGTPLTFLLLRPNDRPILRLLIDAYGAYGKVLESRSLSPDILDHLLNENTAVAFVTVRGDGNAGIAAAMASRTPRRQRAVDDLVALTKHLIKQLPSLEALPTVEGKSAGAWLAMEAALKHPDLYAGSIGFSGAYLFADNPSVASGRDFFGPNDSFDRNGVIGRAACSGQQFRIIHARDDPVIGVRQAELFMRMLKQHGCHGELVELANGGHTIGVQRGSPEVQMLVNAYFTAFGPLAQGDSSVQNIRR